MSEPELIGDILKRCFPSLLELTKCRCCGQLAVASELSHSDECSSCMDRAHNS